MPFEQHINLTVLPAGFSDDGSQVRVSVFVAPRLVTAGEEGAGTTNRTTLDHFPDLVSWPERAKAARFEFATADDASAPPVPVAPPMEPQGPPPETDLWTSLFRDDTPVEPYVFEDARQRDFRTYSARGVGRATRTVYAEAAKASPEALPAAEEAMRPLRAAAATGVEGVESIAAATGGTAPQDGSMPAAMNELMEFHQVRKTVGIAGTDTSPPPPALPEVDFHQMLTSLGDHPALLRRLGLVLDFVLPADRLPASSGERFLSVTPHWTPARGKDSYDVSPRTRYVLLPDRRAFVPGARSLTAADPLASPARGVVALPESKFSVEQADIDGAALKMMQTSSAGTGLFPVRTQGLSLVRDGRLGSLDEEFVKAAEHDGAFTAVVAREHPVDPAAPGPAAPEGPPRPAAPELVAQDLVRGHRMDIWDEDRQRWFSLHEREVEYRRPDGGPLLLTASDEGFFQANLAAPPSDAPDSRLYVPEQIVTWEGWSLSAPRPGLVLDIDNGSAEDHIPPNRPVEVANKAATALPLEITAKVRPGTLPRLRFGHRYRVRLRTVDLAGNGPDVTEADALMDGEDLALPGEGLLVFHRYEAVPAPAVALRVPPGEGASAFRMVIRSSPGAGPPPAAPRDGPGTEVPVSLARVRFGSTNDDVRTVQEALIALGHSLVGGADGVFGEHTRAAYAAEQRAQGFTGRDADGNPGCRSLTELGRKGGFTVDCEAGPADGAGPPPTADHTGRTAEEYAAEFNRSPLVTAEGHVPYHGTDERHVVAPKASLQCVEWHGLLDAAVGSTDQAVQDTVYELAARESGSLDDPSQPNVRLETVRSPAADPENPARTALHTGERVQLPYLPDPLSIGAVFLDLPGTPPGEPFTVRWGGEVWHRPESFRLRLAEGNAPPHFDEASRVLTVSLPKGVVAPVRMCSLIDFDEDVMGMASWCREIPQPPPRLAPETEEEAAARQAEEVRRADHALEVAAAGRHWMFTPWQDLTLVHAVQQPLRAPVLRLTDLATPRASGATAEHLAGTVALDEASTDRIDVVAEWTEVTDAGPTGRDTRTTAVPVFGLLTAGVSREGVPEAEPSLLRNGVLTFSTQAAEERSKASGGKIPPVPEKHEFGDTKHRTVRYRPLAGSRFGDYFPPQFATPGHNALTVQGEATEHSVPSSAPPTAPRVLYCVPTLALEEDSDAPDAVVHRRRGGGIRVYLGRPWFSSGDGELLGVVLGEPPGGDPASVRDAHVTLMGRDPVHRSAPVVAPTPEVFTNAVRQSPPLPLATPSGPLTVTVMGFAPQFDDSVEGGRWFCDLELDTKDACLPFVRLALVRYQPDAVTGAEKSPVVLADLVRTLPDRELRVRTGESLDVSVTGPSWDPTGSLPPRITATLQRRHGAVTDEDLGWVDVEDTVTELTSIDAESATRPFYTGQVPVPSARRGGPLRLLVVETEGIPADGSVPTTSPGPVIYCDTVGIASGRREREDHHRDEGREGHEGREGREGRDGHDDHRGRHSHHDRFPHR